MIHLVLSYLWDSAWAQFGLAGIVLIASVAVFLWAPPALPGARHVAVAVATVCLVFLFLAPKLYIEGIRYEKSKWDAAEAEAVRRGAQARAAAEREIAQRPPGQGIAGRRNIVHRLLHPRRMQHHDAFDRDDR